MMSARAAWHKIREVKRKTKVKEEETLDNHRQGEAIKSFSAPLEIATCLNLRGKGGGGVRRNFFCPWIRAASN